MNKEQLTKVRDALAEGNSWADQVLADYDEKYARHPSTEADREFITDSQKGICEAIAILDAAIAAEPQPAVWMQSDHLNAFISHACGSDSMLARCSHRQLMPDYQPLFTAPVAAQREWVGLTDEEKREFWESQWHVGTAMDFMDTYEAALKEKNHG